MRSIPWATTRTSSVVSGFNRLGLRLLEQLPPRGRLFYSPLSIAVALAALVRGARGDTAAELHEVLGSLEHPEALAKAVSELRGRLDPAWGSSADEPFGLSLAFGVFVEEGFALRPEYRDEMLEAFGADLKSVSFTDVVNAASVVNDWASEKTEGRVRSLVPPASLVNAVLVLVSAVHFRATWRQVFDSAVTRFRAFHRLDGSSVEVSMMQQNGSHQHWHGDIAEAVRLRYEGTISMLIVLPTEGHVHDVGKQLSEGPLDRIRENLRERFLDVLLPRWELRRPLNLKTALQKMGLMAPFDASTVDLSGITSSKEGLVLTDVIHEAWIKVEKEGTEAAAATAVVVSWWGMDFNPEERLRFEVDRPFYFFIEDESTGVILFMGRVLDPSS